MDLIEFCYGSNTSIYEVLQIDQEASLKEIQSAFMSRRLELYQSIQSINIDSEREVRDKDGKVVSVSEKEFVENKMDALVAAFRILRDPRKRRKYDAQLNMERDREKTSSSPRSLLDFKDSSSQELETSLTNDLENIVVDDGEGGEGKDKKTEGKDQKTEEEILVTPQKGFRKFRRLKKGSGASVSSNMTESSRTLNRLESDASVYTAATSKSVRSEFSMADSTVASQSVISKVPTDKTSNSNVKKTKKKLKKGGKNSGIEDDVAKYYKSVVTRRDTTLGSWLRQRDYESSADAIDDAATEIAGSAADIWLSLSQVASAFTVEEDAIDAMAESIEDAAQEFSCVRYV